MNMKGREVKRLMYQEGEASISNRQQVAIITLQQYDPNSVQVIFEEARKLIMDSGMLFLPG